MNAEFRKPMWCRAQLRAGLGLLLVFLFCLCSCTGTGRDPLHIVAGSESKEIEPIIMKVAEDNGFSVAMHYLGSVDMMLELQSRDFAYDAVLPANSMWIRLGDKDLHRVSDEASIMRSPVVLGVKLSKAKELGWTGRDVTVRDILEAVRQGRLHFAMTSATQSNSGASAYMGLLYALAGRPEMLTDQNLNDTGLQGKIKEIFGGVNRSSGSSGWLKDMFLTRYDKLDGMFNYESMIIAANRELTAQGREPLYVIYPTDGLAIADSTLGFVNLPDNSDRKKDFLALRDGLLKPEAQAEIFKTGFRTALIGMNPENVDKSVYNPDWGIDLERTISPVPWPKADVIQRALSLFQTTFRKPSLTFYLLDVSGSMKGRGVAELKRAMTGLLDQNIAGRHMLQASERDITVIIPFNSGFGGVMQAQGNKPEDLRPLIEAVNRLQAGGGTNIYMPVMAAMQMLAQKTSVLQDYLPAIILMTDGKSNNGSLEQVRNFWNQLNAGFELPPVFAVTFGEADESELDSLTAYTVGRVFDGRKHGLEHAFRQAKGYN